MALTRLANGLNMGTAGSLLNLLRDARTKWKCALMGDWCVFVV